MQAVAAEFSRCRRVSVEPDLPWSFRRNYRVAYCDIAHSPQRCSVLVGPDLRAGRFMACTVTLLGRLGDPPLSTFPCTYALANTHAAGDRRFLTRNARGASYNA